LHISLSICYVTLHFSVFLDCCRVKITDFSLCINFIKLIPEKFAWQGAADGLLRKNQK